MVSIYGICEPKYGHLMYIGSSKNPKSRFRQHLYGDRHKNIKTVWMEAMITDGKIPNMFIIEVVEPSERSSAEYFWIDYFRSLGVNLLNTVGARRERKGCPINLLLNPEVEKHVKDLAAKQGLPLHMWIENAITKHMVS